MFCACGSEVYVFYTLQFVKCGFAGANFPTAIFPSMVGRPMLRSEEKVENLEIKVKQLHPLLPTTSPHHNFSCSQAWKRVFYVKGRRK
jgi:hypothetical protein